MADDPTPEPEKGEDATDDQQQVPPQVQAALKKANKEAETLRLRLREFEDQNKTELEKATSRATEASEKLTKTETENLRLRTALSKSLPLELADRLRGDSAEEMAADADRLLALVAPSRPGPPNGGFDPGARDTAPEPGGDMNRQIRQALGRA